MMPSCDSAKKREPAQRRSAANRAVARGVTALVMKWREIGGKVMRITRTTINKYCSALYESRYMIRQAPRKRGTRQAARLRQGSKYGIPFRKTWCQNAARGIMCQSGRAV
eukprot:IDg17129t1